MIKPFILYPKEINHGDLKLFEWDGIYCKTSSQKKGGYGVFAYKSIPEGTMIPIAGLLKKVIIIIGIYIFL